MGGVRFDVLVEIAGSRVVVSETAEPITIATVGDAGGHLESGEMSDDGASEATMKPEQGHQVQRCQRDPRKLIDVRAFGRIEI